ncbi:hypothetical protein niasHT_014308 [Heterodera trifolii]|uniref:Uncharacterized protein n=1 Tax=Heterodera trifolii TaxID=157864 RepID=A0ABD2L7U8_9BILA
MLSPSAIANHRMLATTVMMMTPFGSPQTPMAFQPAGSNCANVVATNVPQPPSSRRSKKSRLDYSNSLCAICNAPADGLHYGAISCRSCNAFFRRSVTYKQHFVCRKGGNCDVDVSVRCACRACRLAKCKLAGMRDTDVQPKRDPTGSQKNRRAPQRRRHADVLNGICASGGHVLKTEMMPSSVNTDFSPNTLLPSVESSMEKHYTMPEVNTCHRQQTLLSCCPPSTAQQNLCQLDNQEQHNDSRTDNAAIQFIKSIKRETMDDDDDDDVEVEVEVEQDDTEQQCHAMEQPTTSHGHQRHIVAPNVGNAQQLHQLARQQQLSNTEEIEQREFDDLVRNYQEHMILMHRAMTPIEAFLCGQYGECQKWRPMEPTDVDLLSKVELGGLMYWIDKLRPFPDLPANDRSVLFKRYSVRKLALDHSYVASKFPKLIADGNFAMHNNTYVPPDRTGFETTRDDERTRKAKYQILRPTIDRQWHSIVLPFAALRITDAEIVVLHTLLLWSASNNRFVQQDSTRQMMRNRREWAVQRLFRHYANVGVPDPTVRLGEILLLLPELEVICDLHCRDFQVAQLFEFGNMSDYWYENYAYCAMNMVG